MAVTTFASGTTGQTSGGAESIISAPNVAGLFQLQLDLNLMAAGDVIELRAYKIVKTGGTSRVVVGYPVAFSGAQSADNQIAILEPIANSLTDTNAVQFGIKQTFGTTRALPYAVLNIEDFTMLPAGAVTPGSNGGLPTTNGTKLNQTVDLTASQLFFKKNTAFSNFAFMMTDSTNHAPVTGLTVTATRKIDSGSFGACANAVTEVSGGWYTINLAAADLNGTTISFNFAATGADTLAFNVVTQP